MDISDSRNPLATRNDYIITSAIYQPLVNLVTGCVKELSAL